jgi:hypothetical protein
MHANISCRQASRVFVLNGPEEMMAEELDIAECKAKRRAEKEAAVKAKIDREIR